MSAPTRKIEELQKALGTEKAAAFVARFEVDLIRRRHELEGNKHSPEIVAGIAHKLVGLAGALGFDDLAAESRALVQRAREVKEPRALEPVLARAVAQCDHVLSTLAGRAD